MKRDHMMGFPALAASAEHASVREPKYGLGVPKRRLEEIRVAFERQAAATRDITRFNKVDHTPEHMKAAAAPAAPATACGWTKWDGGERPVTGLVDAIFRNSGAVYGIDATSLWWSHHGHWTDVVAYRVTQ